MSGNRARGWLRASSVVAAGTLLSRLLGFVRDVLLAQTLGAGVVADAFLVALKIPNLVRRLFAEGAFAAAFVPLLSRIDAEEGGPSARAFAGRALTLLAFVLLVTTALVMIFMPAVIAIIAPGFGSLDPRRAMAIDLARRTIPFALFVSLTALLAGVLNVAGRFALPALAPVLLNVVMIAALLVGASEPAAAARLLAFSLPLAGVLQLAMLWWACRQARMAVRPRFDLRDPNLRQLGARFLPGLAGAGVYHINVLIVTILATSLAPGAVSFLYFADRLAQLPLGLIGIAISTAALPSMARRIAEGRFAEARFLRDQAVEVSLLLTLPAAAGLTALALPIVKVLFMRGQFGEAPAAATAIALQAFAFGIPAAVLVRVLAASFYARGDLRTPLIGAIGALLVNIAIGLATLPTLGYLGLAIGASIASWTNLTILSWQLARLEGRAFASRTKLRGAGALACAVLAASLALRAYRELLHNGEGNALAAAMLVAAIGFFVMVVLFRVVRFDEVTALYRDRA